MGQRILQPAGEPTALPGARSVWGGVRAWEHELATVLATDDGTPESRDCIAHARATAVTAMRDMLLRGIPAGEMENQIWRGP
ncbi:hypothetical protein [Streptomyces erythrochromogenes]|uniref:hypothetical protein n=1 Tax=Streptomyces erythrochromogenes TaxID=285574 RepID=UPI00382A7C32